MKLEYNKLWDAGNKLMAEIDLHLEDHPEDEDLKEIKEFLAKRQAALIFLSQ